ncbi:MAG: phosphotransferase [Arenicellales bacterium]
MNSSREALIQTFLNQVSLTSAAWQDAHRTALAQDASFRRYFRLSLGKKSALLMDAPPPEKPVLIFAQIARFLNKMGLRAPGIIAIDNDHGLMLIEDFGDDTFTKILHEQPDSEQALYDMAIDTLIRLHQHDDFSALPLAPYNTDLLLSEAQLFIDWFFPAVTAVPATQAQKEAYVQAWTNTFKNLKPHADTLVLRDYHVDNLMRVAPVDGSDNSQANHKAQCGLLDFQDAAYGSPAYDLVSLIEDARRKISPQLKQYCLVRYHAGMQNNANALTPEAFSPWLNVLAAQRHAKVLGIFVRLYQRDQKNHYLKHLPHVLALFQSAIAREPLLSPVSEWVTDHLPFSNIDLNQITDHA